MSNPDQPQPSPEELGQDAQQKNVENPAEAQSQSAEKPSATSQEIYDGYLRQREEALGSDNRYFAKQHFGYEVTDEEELMMYYIANGGATGFRERKEAREREHKQEAPEQVVAPKTVYHGSVTSGIEELEPRRRSIPGGADPETHPALIYGSDNPAFAAAHSFLWGTDEGFDLSVENGAVLFRVPEDLRDRLLVPVHLYTLDGKNFKLTPGEGTGHTFHTDQPVKPSLAESFASVTEAIEHFGGRVEFYTPE
ncbi:MAG: hypothetical protein HZC01_04130 [Candidatus Kerfeldbacteria bacterium]|nr:hypothetical protein [Candidatus Kerfeldbacteria bacterium]